MYTEKKIVPTGLVFVSLPPCEASPVIATLIFELMIFERHIAIASVTCCGSAVYFFISVGETFNKSVLTSPDSLPHHLTKL